jgi:hypothetical protein
MFLIIITLFWAFIGTRLIGDLDGYLETNGDPYRCNYLDLGITFTELYALFSYDDYPDLMAPVIANSLYYLLYFIPYALLILYILLPIPVAVVFEAFRVIMIFSTFSYIKFFNVPNQDTPQQTCHTRSY